jgi:hypothetical protein
MASDQEKAVAASIQLELVKASACRSMFADPEAPS